MRFKAFLVALSLVSICSVAAQQPAPIPSEPLKFAAFSARFGGDGAFAIEGPGWPPFKGTWTRKGGDIELVSGGDAAGGCDTGRALPGDGGQGQGARHVRRRVRRLHAAADDPRPERVAAERRSGDRPGAQDRQDRRAVARGDSRGGAGGRQLAVVPRHRGVGSGRWTAPARSLGRRQRRQHPVAHADPRARALEPGGVGQPDLRDQRRQQQSERDLPSGPLRRRRRVRRSVAAALDDLRDRQAHRQDRVGARRARRRAASTSATSSPPTRARPRSPTDGSSSRRSARRACLPTT